MSKSEGDASREGPEDGRQDAITHMEDCFRISRKISRIRIWN